MDSNSKSSISDEEEIKEDVLLYLINELLKVYSLNEIKDLSDLINASLLHSLLIKIDSYFQSDSIKLINEPNTNNDIDSFNDKYSNMNSIISSMELYLIKQKDTALFKFITELNLKEMLNINDLIRNSKPEQHKFAKIILVIISICENRDIFLDKLSDGNEKYLDAFLDIIQKYIDLNDTNTAIIITPDPIDSKKRRFSTRSSVLFNCKDQSKLFALIDKLRKTISDLQEDKESLITSLTKAEEDKKTLNDQIDFLQSTIALYKVKEDDLHMEIQDYKGQLNSFNSSDQSMSMMKSEMLLVEKTQQLAQLDERSTLKISSLNHKISSLQKEILDMHMVNEQSSQLQQENQSLKEEINRMHSAIDDEMEPIRAENERLKQQLLELEKDCNSHQSKIIVLRNDLKVEKQKTEVQNRTIVALQNKFKEIEARPMMNSSNSIRNRDHSMLYGNMIGPLPEEINEDRVKELLMQIQEKELIICDLNKEMALMKLNSKEMVNIGTNTVNETVIEKENKLNKSYCQCHCIDETFIGSNKHDKQLKEIMRTKEELKKQDRDIDFLKKAYSELKNKSEEEYNMVSSSLYELALHLTKIKNEVNNTNSNTNESNSIPKPKLNQNNKSTIAPITSTNTSINKPI